MQLQNIINIKSSNLQFLKYLKEKRLVLIFVCFLHIVGLVATFLLIDYALSHLTKISFAAGKLINTKSEHCCHLVSRCLTPLRR
jgi:hypothetical protein